MPTTQVILHRKEDEGIEEQLEECDKFASTAQGQTGSLMRIDYFTVSKINHFSRKLRAEHIKNFA